MSVDTERVKELLGFGIAQQVVADACGTDTSFIGKLLANDEFREQVSKRRSENLQAATMRDRKLDSIEDRLIAKYEETIEWYMKPGEVLSALRTVNSLKRRGMPADPSVGQKSNIVNLTIPVVLLHDMRTNGQGEVVLIDNQPMTGMPAAQLLRSLQDDPNKRDNSEQYAKVASYLPGAAIETNRIKD